MMDQEKLLKEYENKGYDAYVELLCQNNCPPRAGECPARFMKEGAQRTAYIKGWCRAQREYQQDKKETG